MLLTNLTEVNPEEAQETLEALGGFFHNLNLRTLLTIGLLIVGCLVVMKIVLRLLDRTFRRLELERGLCTFLHAALRVVLWLVTVCIVLGYIGVPMTRRSPTWRGASRCWYPSPSRRGTMWRPAGSPAR